MVKKKTYAEKLRHPNWQRKRLDILGRDDFRCQACGCREITLHVHHLSYIRGREPWEYDDDNFQTLCQYCHRITETIKDPLIKVIIYDIDEPYFVYYAISLFKKTGAYTTYIFFINETIFDFRAAIGNFNLEKIFTEIEKHKTINQ